MHCVNQNFMIICVHCLLDFHHLEECPPPPRPPPPTVEVVVPPRPPPPAEAPMDAQAMEMLQRPPEDNRIAVSISVVEA